MTSCALLPFAPARQFPLAASRTLYPGVLQDLERHVIGIDESGRADGDGRIAPVAEQPDALFSGSNRI
jgi:hypothetical protein